MISQDNPVGRLHSIFESVTKVGRDDDKISIALAKVFQIEPENRYELFQIYAGLLQLVRTAKTAVEHLPGVDHDLYTSPFDRIELGFLTLSLNHPLKQLKDFLSPSTMTALMFCSDTLSNRHGEKLIGEEELAKLLTEVEKLLKTVLATQLDDSLRTFLVDHLEQIRKAILYYRINGADGLQEALENTIGSMYFFRKEIDEESHEDNDSGGEVKKIKKGFMQVIEHLSKLISFAKDIKELLGGDLLPLLGP